MFRLELFSSRGLYVPVVNYPSADVPFTRIVEYKHTPNQPVAARTGEVKGTLIAKEYSTAEGEPYYPVPNPENRALYEKYAEVGGEPIT